MRDLPPLEQRKRLDRTRFIGITGSCAKTTTKELLAAVLARRYRTRKSHGSFNGKKEFLRVLATLRRSDEVCLQEVGAGGAIPIQYLLELLQPEVGVVTHVMRDHFSLFRSRERVAKEKRKLVQVLPEHGLAVLNRDDELVWAMRRQTRARVVSFGRDDRADVYATEVRGSWPDPLSLTLVHAGRSYPVTTRLLGEHWAHGVAAAFAAGVELGVPPDDALAALAEMPPVECRMSPVTTRDGVCFIDDAVKASYDGFPATFDFLAKARGERKMLVMGTLSSYPGSRNPKYREIVRRALDAGAHVCLVGGVAQSVRLDIPEELAPRVVVHGTLREADRALRAWTRPGDLVLLKGSRRADHLERLYLSRDLGPDGCWRPACGRARHCRRCELLTEPETT